MSASIRWDCRRSRPARYSGNSAPVSPADISSRFRFKPVRSIRWRMPRRRFLRSPAHRAIVSSCGRRDRVLAKPLGIAMPSAANIVILSGLLIGLVYGAVGLLSGFCLMSSLRGWWAQGDSRLVRRYALALGVGIVTTQLLAGNGTVDLTKSVYLQRSFSVPLMFL